MGGASVGGETPCTVRRGAADVVGQLLMQAPKLSPGSEEKT